MADITDAPPGPQEGSILVTRSTMKALVRGQGLFVV
jgi:hypothetical protein